MNDDVVIKGVKKFDMAKEPGRVRWFLRPVTWVISYPSIFRHRTKIEKINMEGVKPPYLLLCNHNSFYDMKVATAATFPHQAYFVVAVDGFIGREWLMRSVGCIGKRKFTNDISLVRNLQKVMERGKIAAVYPEARYSLCGTNAILPASLGKLVKLLKVPVVTLITQGNHIVQPFYNPKNRKIRTAAKMSLLFNQREIDTLSAEELNIRLNEAFLYDDFKWQKENKIRVKYKKRAEGLHKVLYQCPHCKKEYRMTSKGTQLLCNACGKEWHVTEYGELRAEVGETYFSHIPSWYEWERENVRKEVLSGSYFYEGEVRIKMLPNSRGFINLGSGTLTHNSNGFELTGKYGEGEFNVKLPPSALYSVHIEYNYTMDEAKGDCIDLSTLKNTFYVFPKGEDFSVTKMSLATEELFVHYQQTAKLLDTKESKKENEKN